MKARWWFLLTGIALQVVCSGAGACATCEPVSVGSSVDDADIGFGALFTRTFGQSFWADHRDVDSIEVWRVATIPSQVPMHLIVTGFDATNDVPVPSDVILDGPSIVTNTVEPDGRSIRIVYRFDPPLQLPSTGEYALFFEGCTGTEPWRIYADLDNGYSGGNVWLSARGCPVSQQMTAEPDHDLSFRVSFCVDSATPTKRASWGDLKIRYR